MKALCRKNTKFHFFTQIKVLSNALSHEHNIHAILSSFLKYKFIFYDHVILNSVVNKNGYFFEESFSEKEQKKNFRLFFFFIYLYADEVDSNVQHEFLCGKLLYFACIFYNKCN